MFVFFLLFCLSFHFFFSQKKEHARELLESPNDDHHRTEQKKNRGHKKTVKRIKQATKFIRISRQKNWTNLRATREKKESQKQAQKHPNRNNNNNGFKQNAEKKHEKWILPVCQNDWSESIAVRLVYVRRKKSIQLLQFSWHLILINKPFTFLSEVCFVF